MAETDAPSAPRSAEITALLRDWGAGDQEAEARVLPLVYDELRILAASHFKDERGGHTLQPTALVHEAYLRLVGAREKISWQSRGHFYRTAARTMRRILVEHARTRLTLKRGGALLRVPLEGVEIAVQDHAAGLVALDGALEKLAHEYPRQSEVVVLKFFGGLEASEIAELHQVSAKTVLRDWNFARVWLYRELDSQSGHY